MYTEGRVTFLNFVAFCGCAVVLGIVVIVILSLVAGPIGFVLGAFVPSPANSSTATPTPPIVVLATPSATSTPCTPSSMVRFHTDYNGQSWPGVTLYLAKREEDGVYFWWKGVTGPDGWTNSVNTEGVRVDSLISFDPSTIAELTGQEGWSTLGSSCGPGEIYFHFRLKTK